MTTAAAVGPGYLRPARLAVDAAFSSASCWGTPGGKSGSNPCSSMICFAIACRSNALGRLSFMGLHDRILVPQMTDLKSHRVQSQFGQFDLQELQRVLAIYGRI